jgi:hypothetical protein
MMMTWFERVMHRFGWVRADDLSVQKLNAEFAFAKLGRLEPAFEALREDHAVTVDVRARELSVLRARAAVFLGSDV